MFKFFEWTKLQGKTMAEVARDLGYTERHLYRLKKRQVEDPAAFIEQVRAVYGEEATLFFADVSVAPTHDQEDPSS